MILGQSSIEGLDPRRVLELDLISVKGKNEPERIYTMLDVNFEMNELEEFLQDHSEFIEMYRAQEWDGAKAHIKKYAENIPSFNLYFELISNRIEAYIENPPPSDWQGVFVAETK